MHVSRNGSTRATARPVSIASPKRSRRDQPLADALERVNAQLAEALPFEHDPVVVPVRKKVFAETQLVEARTFVTCRIEQTACLRLGGRDVDSDARDELDRLAARLDEPPLAV